MPRKFFNVIGGRKHPPLHTFSTVRVENRVATKSSNKTSLSPNTSDYQQQTVNHSYSSQQRERATTSSCDDIRMNSASTTTTSATSTTTSTTIKKSHKVSFAASNEDNIVCYIPNRHDYTIEERRLLYYTDEEIQQILDDMDLEKKLKSIWNSCVSSVSSNFGLLFNRNNNKKPQKKQQQQNHVNT